MERTPPPPTWQACKEQGLAWKDYGQTNQQAMLCAGLPWSEFPLDAQQRFLDEAIVQSDAGRLIDLIRSNVNLETPDSDGNTPLLQALLIIHSSVRYVDRIISHRHYGHRDILFHLLNAHVSLNVRNKKGQTPLSILINSRALWPDIKQLIDAGASVLFVDGSGRTPLDQAHSHYPEVAPLLAQHAEEEMSRK